MSFASSTSEKYLQSDSGYNLNLSLAHPSLLVLVRSRFVLFAAWSKKRAAKAERAANGSCSSGSVERPPNKQRPQEQRPHERANREGTAEQTLELSEHSRHASTTGTESGGEREREREREQAATASRRVNGVEWSAPAHSTPARTIVCCASARALCHHDGPQRRDGCSHSSNSSSRCDRERCCSSPDASMATARRCTDACTAETDRYE